MTKELILNYYIPHNLRLFKLEYSYLLAVYVNGRFYVRKFCQIMHLLRSFDLYDSIMLSYLEGYELRYHTNVSIGTIAEQSIKFVKVQCCPSRKKVEFISSS